MTGKSRIYLKNPRINPSLLNHSIFIHIFELTLRFNMDNMD